ncbi:PTS system N-acetylglucosamine-specific IIA component [Murinocardiopsis flavida]|uniref:PTS system N-acetylglucosamine-specific IIA component n=1 Tax=Murinocardiopsis flavida TaxID=645275 RepID=A0A2P8DIT0_9ACTN|nr:PTS glucose transporter subunit IIA [Murinocardiopsis flavida]PSK97132.1 PTS system N-acetylglucosamine-specific IIA component [Murinocardiopsis flavida]
MFSVRTPVAGSAVGLAAVPDPVFAEAMVGPGTAVTPNGGSQEAVAPVAGTVVKLHAHAYVVVGADGRGVLVHLGIDTVNLNGAGFEKLVDEGAEVEAGRPLIRWNPDEVAARGLSPIVPVVALDAAADAVSAIAEGAVAVGDPLFQWA